MKENRIRFGIVGTNFISEWVITGGKQDPRFEVVAVCSRSQDTADAFAVRHQIPMTFTSLEEMAASNEIDAVYIASPTIMHSTQSIMCMQQGKHVLCEKPMASSADEVRAMINVAREKGVVLMEAMKTTLTPNFSMLQDNLYRIGEIRMYSASFCQYSSRYDKFKAGIHVNAFDPAFATGATMDIGVYCIYPMVVLFGKPNSIKAEGILHSSGVDGLGTVVFDYGRMKATISYSKISDSYLPTEIQGETGSLLVDRVHQFSALTFCPRTPSSTGIGTAAIPENISAATTQHEYFYEVQTFIDLILSGKLESSVNSHTNSFLTLEIADEIRKQLGVTVISSMKNFN